MGARAFPNEEYDRRIEKLRQGMADQGFDAVLIAAPENVFYLSGLDHQGYFAFQMLIVPVEGKPILITRAMERAIVRDMVPNVRHAGYSDGIAPLPPAEDRGTDILLGSAGGGDSPVGLQPWSMSLGVSTRNPEQPMRDMPAAVKATCDALKEAGLEKGRLAMDQNSSFMPYRIADGIVKGLPEATWLDPRRLVDDCRIQQSPLELKYTREAAKISESMLLAAIAAAGPGVDEKDVMAALYQAMFQRGGTYPGFIPLVRSTRTLEHEHGTWTDARLASGDILFLEMAGCVRRYHAPMGRLVFVGRAPKRTDRIQKVCEEAMMKAAERIKPGAEAREVYGAWQAVLDAAGMTHYRRHHCGYSVGIGYPPSWSGNGVPVGLRADSIMPLKEGMVFHLMSWLLRTGKGDYFLSDTVEVTANGCRFLTDIPRGVTVR